MTQGKVHQNSGESRRRRQVRRERLVEPVARQDTGESEPAGALQEWMGYTGFFWWIMGCCLVTLAVTALIKVDPSFGLKGNSGQ